MACENEKSSFYPEFVPNQLLTNTQLNQLRDYLDQQDRRGRVRLVGTGIVCGLGFSVDAGGHVAVGEGFGVTSDGYLIELPVRTYTHYRSYEDPDFEEEEDETKTPLYEPWQDDGGGQLDILELLEDDTPDGATALESDTGDDRVLVLYLEKEPVDLRSCIVTDCNDKGSNVHLTVRALLVLKTDLAQLTPCDTPPAQARIPRFHTVTALAGVTSASVLNSTWGQIVSDHAEPLADEIEAVFERFETFLELEESDLDKVRGCLSDLETAAGDNTLRQYHYDVLKDLATAYNEFVVAACELVTDCCPVGNFARHLMLGALDGTELYRHEFVPSPVKNVLYGDLERVRKLFLRMAAMADALDFGAAADGMRLTASHTEVRALGERAVPFYYELTTVEELWQPRLCCTTDPLWSYHRPGDVDLDYNRCSFLRIEGHLDLSCETARNTLVGLRRQHNAELHVLVAHLGDPFAGEDVLREDVTLRLVEEAAAEKELRALVLKGEGVDAGEVLEAATTLTELKKELSEAVDEWAETRCSWQLQCDAVALFVDYRAVRSELFCLLHHLLGELAAVGEPDVVEPSEGWRTMLLERMVGGLLAVREIDEGIAAQVEEVLDGYQAWDLEKCALRTLDLARGALRERIRDLLGALPSELCELSYEHFFARSRKLTRDLLYFWLLWQGRDVAHPVGAEDPAAAVLAVLRGCLKARVKILYFAYEQLRSRDLSLFSNLVDRIDGLEHLAGVGKCGTFVLVCENGSVVADFSLSCHLPCCCEVDLSQLVLPLVAMPDTRVVRLEEGGEESGFLPVELEIDVVANDYDPADFERHLDVNVEEGETLLGGEVDVGGDGVVRYFHAAPVPGLVDRFTYKLEQEEDERAAVGEVLVLMIAEPEETSLPGTVLGTVTEDGIPLPGENVELSDGRSVLTDAGGDYAFTDLELGIYTITVREQVHSGTLEPGGTLRLDFDFAVLPGAIAGQVISDGAPLPGITVTISSGGAAITNVEGKYSIQGLAPGTYTVTVSDLSKVATVKAGETETVNFDFGGSVETGNVHVLVSAERDVILITTGLVTLFAVDGGFQKTATIAGSSGAFELTDVPVGVVLRVSVFKQGYQLAFSDNFSLTAGETLEVPITLSPFAIVVPDTFVSILAERGSLSLEEVRSKAEEVYGGRYEDRLSELDLAGEDPAVRRSLSYQAAEEFLTVTLANEQLGDDEVSEAYEKAGIRLVASARRATAERRNLYQGLLTSVSLGLMDRLTLTQPLGLRPESQTVVGKLVGNLRRAQVDVAEVRRKWEGETLVRELGVAAADGIREDLG